MSCIFLQDIFVLLYIMEEILLEDIEIQARELMNRYNLYHNYIHISHERLS
jgi:hypothetical protein